MGVSNLLRLKKIYRNFFLRKSCKLKLPSYQIFIGRTWKNTSSYESSSLFAEWFSLILEIGADLIQIGATVITSQDRPHFYKLRQNVYKSVIKIGEAIINQDSHYKLVYTRRQDNKVSTKKIRFQNNFDIDYIRVTFAAFLSKVVKRRQSIPPLQGQIGPTHCCAYCAIEYSMIKDM